MFIVDVINQEVLIGTIIFSFLCVINAILSQINEKTNAFTKNLFIVEIIIFMMYCIIYGHSNGFSIIWILLLPSLGFVLFGRKPGIIISSIMFFVFGFFFWIPMGQNLIQHEPYDESFLVRFPFAYLAFFVIGLFLEIIRAITFEKYKYSSTHDNLTKALNRDGFSQYISKKLNNDNNGHIYAMIDIDHFKNVNDLYGHFIGDIVLFQVASILSQELGSEICRWGGEEFSCVLDYDDEDKINKVLDRIRQEEIEVENAKIKITVSIGYIKTSINYSLNKKEIWKEVDHCLYDAKEKGRDRFVSKEI